MTLPVPASGTVLSMVGLNFNLTNYMPQALQGVFSTAPYVMQKVSYPASLSSRSISTGVKNFDDAVRSVAGQKIGFGHSQGAQVMTRWMNTYKDDPTAPDPSELMFILIGNPLRSTGGYIIGRPEVDGVTGVPTPTDTPWTIVDCARRYDGWADWVTDTTNDMAVQNANSGKQLIHTHYENVDLYDPDNTVWTAGNTTYVLTQEAPPYLKSMRKTQSVTDTLAAEVQADIESAYNNRPPTDVVEDPEATTTVDLVNAPSIGWWALVRKWLGIGE